MLLSDVLKKIEDHSLILPDFQREYVWVSEDKVRGFIASVLCQIPVGNIITFKQKASVFANKEIGFVKSIELDPEDEVFFLLDGQQRITTLALFFSDMIFSKILNFRNIPGNDYRVKDLSSPEDMRRRYFIKMPNVDATDKDSCECYDIFGLMDFNFTGDPQNVSFCTNQFDDLIEEIPFNDSNKDDWFYPKNISSMNPSILSNYRASFVTNRKMPLFLLHNNRNVFNKILNDFKERRLLKIKSIYTPDNIDYVKEYVRNHPNLNIPDDVNDPAEYYEMFINGLKDISDKWYDDMITYFTKCLDLDINECKVENAGAAKAINIYEALNTGGAVLTTFDLIIAKAANKENVYGKEKSFYKWIHRCITNHCNKSLLHFISGGEINDWTADKYMGGLTKNRITKVYINQYLNLLCIISNFTDENGNPFSDIKDLDAQYCKEKKQLEIKPEQIWKYSTIAMNCVCDAFMIMNLKFGVINSSSVCYELMVLVISYSMFLLRYQSLKNINSMKAKINSIISGMGDISEVKKEHIRNEELILENELTYDYEAMHKVIEKIVAWYWFSIFSGEYSTDQSTRVINHIKWMHNWIIKNEKPEMFKNENLETNLSLILNVDRYNSKQMLCMESDNYVKTTVRDSLIQYILSTKPYDFIKDDNNNNIVLKAYDRETIFAIHHMIPLGSATSLRQSTEELRDDKRHILNSPLNLAYISQKANGDISARQINDYLSSLSDDFLSNYKFDNRVKSFRFDGTESSKTLLKEILGSRYELIQGEIKNKIRAICQHY